MYRFAVVCPNCHITESFETVESDGQFYEKCNKCKNFFLFELEKGKVIRTDYSNRTKRDVWDETWGISIFLSIIIFIGVYWKTESIITTLMCFVIYWCFMLYKLM